MCSAIVLDYEFWNVVEKEIDYASDQQEIRWEKFDMDTMLVTCSLRVKFRYEVDLMAKEELVRRELRAVNPHPVANAGHVSERTAAGTSTDANKKQRRRLPDDVEPINKLRKIAVHRLPGNIHEVEVTLSRIP